MRRSPFLAKMPIRLEYLYFCTVTPQLKTWTTAIISPSWYVPLAKNYLHKNQKLNVINCSDFLQNWQKL